LQRNATLSIGRLLRSLYLLYFSKPAAERALLRAVRTRPIRSLVELGIGRAERTHRILEIASWKAGSSPLRYTGIDLFEARPSGRPRFPLKHAFATLKRPQVQMQLVPGDAAAALKRVANSLTGTDLLLISADHDPQSLARAWTWIPRMLTPASRIFVEEAGPAAGQTKWRAMTLVEIQRLAADAGKPVRRAA
jgi:hypothetical protein